MTSSNQAEIIDVGWEYISVKHCMMKITFTIYILNKIFLVRKSDWFNRCSFGCGMLIMRSQNNFLWRKGDKNGFIYGVNGLMFPKLFFVWPSCFLSPKSLYRWDWDTFLSTPSFFQRNFQKTRPIMARQLESETMKSSSTLLYYILENHLIRLF